MGSLIWSEWSSWEGRAFDSLHLVGGKQFLFQAAGNPSSHYVSIMRADSSRRSSVLSPACRLSLKSEALHRRLHISNPPHVTPSLLSVPCLLLCVIYIGTLLFGVTAGSLRALIQQDSACKVIHVCSDIDSIRGRCWQICRFTADLKSFSAGISQANSLSNDTQPACQQIYLFTGSHGCPSL